MLKGANWTYLTFLNMFHLSWLDQSIHSPLPRQLITNSHLTQLTPDDTPHDGHLVLHPICDLNDLGAYNSHDHSFCDLTTPSESLYTPPVSWNRYGITDERWPFPFF